jgi:hypothetical protein
MLLSHIYTLRETYQKEKNNSYRKIIFNCHFVNSIVNSQARFHFPLPEAIEINWHFVFHFVSYVASFLFFVCSNLPWGLRRLVNVDDSISNNSPYCIIAHTRVYSCSTPAKEKRKIETSNLLIWSRDRKNSLISCRKRLFIFHLTLKIIIKREEWSIQNEQQWLKYKIEKRCIVKKSS